MKPRLYFLITFAVTCIFWGIGARVSHQPGNDGSHMMWMLPGLLTPFLVSYWMIHKDPEARKQFRDRLLKLKRIRPGLLLTACLLMPLSVLVSVGLSLLLGGSPDQLQLADEFSFRTGFVPVFLLLLMAATFEELGWRGYAYDSLQAVLPQRSADLLFGLLWSLWHLPLILVKDSYQYVIFQDNPWFAINFFVSIIPLGIIISRVCVANQKSIPAAILFHFVINLSQEALNISQTTKCLQTGVLTLAAFGLWYKSGRE